MSAAPVERIVRVGLRKVEIEARQAKQDAERRAGLYKRCKVGHPLWARWNATVEEAALRVISDGKLGVSTVPAYAADVVGMQIEYCRAVARLKKFEAIAASRGEDLDAWMREDHERRHGKKNSEPVSVPAKEQA